MLILENGGKSMKDGLETKAPSSQFDQLYLIHRKVKKEEKAKKEESDVKCCILILDGQKVVKINPELEINNSQDIDGMY